MMPIVGFLPADDPRMLATIDAIADRLTDERGLGLPLPHRGRRRRIGGRRRHVPALHVLACPGARTGRRVERARRVFTTAIAFLNDVGLLAEEVDPSTGELLGNFPQAFSHIGLVNAAWAISEAEARAGEG